jgi:hypothetical protein
MIAQHGLYGALIVGMLVLMPGCTTLTSHPVPAGNAAYPSAAFPYSLTKAKFLTTFTVTLAACGETPKIKVTAVATPAFEPDPLERYYIDSAELQSLYKMTTLKVATNSDQTLQSLNGEYNDQTLQIVGSVIQSAAQIAGAGSLAGIPVASLATKDIANDYFETRALEIPVPTTGAPVEACNATAVKDLKALRDAKSQLKTAQANSKANLNATDPVVTQATSEVTKASGKLTVTLPITIRPELPDLQSSPITPNVDIVSYPVDMLGYLRDRWFNNQLANVIYNGGTPVPNSNTFNVSLEILRWSDICTTVDAKSGAKQCASSPTAANVDGVVIRQPARAVLRVCQGECVARLLYGLLPVDKNNVAYDVAVPIDVVVPQYGKKIILPLHNHIGTDVSLGLTLGADGSVSSLSFGSTTNVAAGVNAIGAAGNAATTAITADDTAIAAHNTAVAAASTAAVANAQYADTVLKAQADCIAQQAAIVKSGQTPSVQCK